MADVDEDAIPNLDPNRPRQSNDESSSDDDLDAAPDYTALNTINKRHALPARGEKDFEPNPTSRQATSLETSRQAMQEALSVIRVHNNRQNQNVGVYFTDPAEWDAARFETAALDKVSDLLKREKMSQSSVMKREGRCVAVEKFIATFSRTMGQQDRRNWSWLLPEEALFLLERGTLDIRYSVDEIDERDELVVGDVPMSLQGAYAAFLGKSGLTLERYLVYANLRRGGYIVQRAPTWNGPVEKVKTLLEKTEELAVKSEEFRRQQLGEEESTFVVFRLLRQLFATPAKPVAVPCYNSASGPLISPGLFRSYGDVFRQLYLVPQHSSGQSADVWGGVEETIEDGHEAAPPLLPTWHINKPSALQSYKKSAPPEPHYIVVVIDARQTSVPTSKQLGNILDSMPEDYPVEMQRKRLENRIKHGRRNIMLAVVDSGLISFLRFSSEGFGPGNILWEENEKRGATRSSKRGGSSSRGKGGGRGRGRGRGR